MRTNPESIQACINQLKKIPQQLSKAGKTIISLPQEEWQGFLAKQQENVLETSIITCMETLKKSQDDEYGVSMMVLGTEHCDILILDQAGESVLKTMKIPGIPLRINTQGLYDVDYRFLIATRDSKIYQIRNGELSGTVIELESSIIGFARLDKGIAVATMDRQVSCYHVRGKKLFSSLMPADIVSIISAVLSRTKTFRGHIVALQNGEIRLYSDKSLIDIIQTNDFIRGICFGVYGKEEGNLVISYNSGAFAIKALARQADLNTQLKAGPPPEQDIPLTVPKKTLLFLEQQQREKEQNVEMYRQFLKDYCKMRRDVVASYSKLMTEGDGPLQYEQNQVTMSIQVRGIGPQFLLDTQIENLSKKSILGSRLVLHYKPDIYRVVNYQQTIPLLLQNTKYKTQISILQVGTLNDVVRVLLAGENTQMPLFTVLVQMPAADVSVQALLE